MYRIISLFIITICFNNAAYAWHYSGEEGVIKKGNTTLALEGTWGLVSPQGNLIDKEKSTEVTLFYSGGST